MDDAPWTLEQVEAAINELSEEQLLARYRQCVERGHVWRPLDASVIPVREAEWCGRYLKMKTESSRGGLSQTVASRTKPAVTANSRVSKTWLQF
jgi:hypothetical protein